MIEQLNKSIKQLRKVNNVPGLCEKLLNVEDDAVMNTIYEASTNIDNAANAISEIVGREILAKRYYSHSLFEIKGDLFDGADQDQEGLTNADDSFPTDSDDNNEKEDRISELREVVDRADEILNHNKEERKDEGNY